MCEVRQSLKAQATRSSASPYQNLPEAVGGDQKFGLPTSSAEKSRNEPQRQRCIPSRRWVANRSPIQTYGPLRLYLFLAARAQLVAERISPVLIEPNNVIICDRYIDSTVAYQGYGFGFDINFIKQANSNAIGDFVPNLTILIDCPIETSIARTISRTGKVSRFETKPNDFHQRVRNGFIELANENHDRWKIVDGTLDEKTLSKHILSLALDVIDASDINVK